MMNQTTHPQQQQLQAWQEPFDPVFQAIQDNHYQNFKSLLNEHPEWINAQTTSRKPTTSQTPLWQYPPEISQQSTPLMWALAHSRRHFVRYLLKNEMTDVLLLDADGNNALHYAAIQDNTTLLEATLEAYAQQHEAKHHDKALNLHIKNNKQHTPLTYAIFLNRTQHFPAFLEADPEIFTRRENLTDPSWPIFALIQAKRHTFLPIVLREHNLPLTRTHQGKTALHEAIIHHNELFAMNLITHAYEQRMRLDVTDAQGNSLLHYAVSYNRFHVFEHLLNLRKRGCSVPIGMNKKGETLLFVATDSTTISFLQALTLRTELREELLQMSRQPDHQGTTPHALAQQRSPMHASLMEWLLSSSVVAAPLASKLPELPVFPPLPVACSCPQCCEAADPSRPFFLPASPTTPESQRSELPIPPPFLFSPPPSKLPYACPECCEAAAPPSPSLLLAEQRTRLSKRSVSAVYGEQEPLPQESSKKGKSTNRPR